MICQIVFDADCRHHKLSNLPPHMLSQAALPSPPSLKHLEGYSSLQQEVI